MGDTGTIIQLVNLAITGGVFVYAVRVEHRLTRLETTLEHITRRNHHLATTRRQEDVDAPRV